MLMLMYQHSSWSNFYTNGGPSQTYGTSTNQIQLSAGGAYVYNAVFENLYTSSSGGAIYCSSISLLFLSEMCSFINCTSTGSGGAIYIIITGESILSKVCSYRCVASSHFQFECVEVNSDITKRNEVLDTSACYSIHKGNHNCVFDQYYGNVKFNSVNSSQNECSDDPGITCQCSSGEGCCIVEYCSVTNNTAKTFIIIGLFASYGKQIRSCNVLNNKQLTVTSSYGLIYADAMVTIENTCILGNDANYQVYGPSGSVVSNCTIDFDLSKVRTGVSITNTPGVSFINKIACFETPLCEAFYDEFGKLTVYPDIVTNMGMCTCKCKQPLWNANFIFELIIFVSTFTSY
jgi:predicted outer membrane repeat protein